ncbi:hypothetical protein [Maribacter sp. HTCC2170]|uniref:hypothetical protein n=1 Tax=Maribacter sp. (strain HTCC2170 / KCCM 42371) TaxID=313603 RepID=UPI00006BD55B|nr:hypothetical protein [Maribacter sp. HTCC2170]EAR02136.1 hypothetical protein FB2170_02595 [Maribacter sp. HTCC2170]
MKKNRTYLLAVFVSMLLFSCIEEQDFNQYDDLSVTPTFEASILYMEVPERTINLVTGLNTYSQNFNFDAFAEDIFSERVLEGVLTYEVANTTSKPLEIEIQFLDEAGAVLDTERFMMDAEPTATLQREIAYGPAGRSIDIIRNTSSIFLTATNLGDNSSTSSQSNPLISLKSSGKFTVRIK